MGAEELLKPVVELPKGLPPKNLIVWVFALLMIMIVALALLTTASEPTLKTADEVVRDVASKLNANDKVLLDKGTTWVDDAYSSSGLATQIAQAVVSPPAAFSLSSAANVSPPVAPTPSAIPFLNGLGEQAHQTWLNPAPTKVVHAWSNVKHTAGHTVGHEHGGCGQRGGGDQLQNDGGRF